ncbi:hypothetical protein LTR53_019021, partial [Teratosphaeriaceae sp. CCFEE 6253]
ITAIEARAERVARCQRVRGHLVLADAEGDFLETLQYPQILPAAVTFVRTGLLRPETIAVFADVSLGIANLEVGHAVLEEMGLGGPDLAAARTRILKLDEDTRADFHSRSISVAHYASLLVDQQQAAAIEPPLLTLDARDYEPLKADPTEFWPHNQLMLLDM